MLDTRSVALFVDKHDCFDLDILAETDDEVLRIFVIWSHEVGVGVVGQNRLRLKHFSRLLTNFSA